MLNKPYDATGFVHMMPNLTFGGNENEAVRGRSMACPVDCLISACSANEKRYMI